MLIETLCRDFFISNESTLINTLSNNVDNFRVSVIKKNTEKERVIFVPKKITKMCQKYVLRNFLEELPCSESVISYKKGKSIVNNCYLHKNGKYFLHLDIKHFFNRMDWETFVQIIFKRFPESDFCNCLKDERDYNLLKNILCFKGKIVQGSVTSPYISNLYLLDLDDFVDKKIIPFVPNGVYSRYSDDIFISSSEYIKHDIIEQIKNAIALVGLKLNYSKIKYKRLNSSIRITGITLTKNKQIILGTAFKKNLKKDIYLCLKNNGKGIDFNSLLGKLYYLKSVDTLYFNFLQDKYSKNSVTMMTQILDLHSSLKTENLQKNKND